MRQIRKTFLRGRSGTCCANILANKAIRIRAAVPEQHALGSGFIIDPAGYIATNNHVVDGAREISVTLSDGNKYPAKVIGRDSRRTLPCSKSKRENHCPTSRSVTPIRSMKATGSSLWAIPMVSAGL